MESSVERELVITDKAKCNVWGHRKTALVAVAALVTALGVGLLSRALTRSLPEPASAVQLAVNDETNTPPPAPMEKRAVVDDQQPPVKAVLVPLPPIDVTPVAGAKPAADTRPAAALLEEAKKVDAEANGSIATLEKARALYQQALDQATLDETAAKACLARLTALTNEIVLNPKVVCTAPKAVIHVVEPGDVAEKIARKYKVNQGQLKRLNKLDDKLTVRYGEKLKMLLGDVVFKVDRTRLFGTLYIDGVFVRRYPVGIGPENATPKGIYTVQKKVVNPDWFYEGKRLAFGDPANVIGTRWMSLVQAENSENIAGLGVHGTSKTESVPGRSSKGCVRLKNSDVEELYDLMPQGGKVEILN